MEKYTPSTLPEREDGTFRIPEDNMDTFNERMAKLNRRAARLGTDPVSAEITGEYLLETRERMGGLDDEFGMEPRYRTVLRKYFVVRVSGKAPAVAGWTFVATIQHEEEGNILRTVHGWDGTLPEEFRGSDSTRCDHCHTRRARRDTYVLVSDAGEFQQVGRSCLADFLGGTSPERLAEWCESLAGLEGYLTGGFDTDGAGIRYYDLPSLLVNATVLGRLHGFRSRAQAMAESTEMNPVISTASWCNSLYFGSPKMAQKLGAEIDEARTIADVEFAHAALAWAQNIEAPKSDYEWNIRTLANSGAIQARSFGFAVSIVTSYKKRLEGEAKRELARRMATASEWIGTPKKREEFSLLVTGTRAYESMYGTGVLVFFADAAGNRAKWFASNAAEVDWPAGQTVRVKATVKAHETYRDAKETLLTRVTRLDAPKPVEMDLMGEEAGR